MKTCLHLLLTTCLLTCFYRNADAQGWHQRYPFASTVWSVGVLNDGYQIAFQQADSLKVGRTDLAGNLLETVNFGAFPTDFALIPSPEKAVFKASLLPPDSQLIQKILLEKLDSMGQLRWQVILGDTVSAYDVRVAADADGAAYLSAMYRYPEHLNWWSENQKVDIQKVDSSGTVLWREAPASWVTPVVNGWPLSNIGEISVLNNGRVAVWTTTNFNYSAIQGGLVLDGGNGQSLFTIGTSGCDSPSAAHGEFKAVRAAGTAGEVYLFKKSSCSSVGGGHSGGWYWANMTRLNPQGQVISSVDFPNVYWDIQTYWKPFPILDTETANGDVISIVQDSSAKVSLWRGSVDLQDTIWRRPIFSPSVWLYTFSHPSPRPGRIFRATPDGGAILGIAPNDSTISLTKIDFDGNIGNNASLPGKEPRAAREIFLTPNPASETTGFALPQTEGLNCTVAVFAVDGSVFSRKNLTAAGERDGESRFEVNVRDLPSGLWFLRVTGDSGRVWTGKLAKF